MSKGISQYEKASAELRRMVRAGTNRKCAMRKRLAKRDRDYAESGCAAPVTVEERDLRNSELGRIMRIETRGQVCIASRCNFTTHN